MDCASSPQNNQLNYKWTRGNGGANSELLFEENTQNKQSKYTYTVKAESLNSVFEILCTVSNEIVSTKSNEDSQTRIRIRHKKPTG